jgi:uncharacterized membrane protein
VARAPKGGDEFEKLLARFRKLPRPVRIIYSRPRTFIAVSIGVAAFLLLYLTKLQLVTRLLIGWDAFAALYLILVYVMMLQSAHHHNIRRHAIMQDDGRLLILVLTGLGAFASIAAIVFELGAGHGVAALVLAMLTITLSWATVHTSFALHYAHDYYDNTPGGLQFPSGDETDHADYWDFVYFSFVIGMTAQVSDVGITDKVIRRTVTVHGIISFLFNTALLALMVNIAASAISS